MVVLDVQMDLLLPLELDGYDEEDDSVDGLSLNLVCVDSNDNFPMTTGVTIVHSYALVWDNNFDEEFFPHISKVHPVIVPFVAPFDAP